jgi:hypothetical protein
MDRAACNSPGRARSRAKSSSKNDHRSHLSRCPPGAASRAAGSAGNARRGQSAHAAELSTRALVLAIRWQAVRSSENAGLVLPDQGRQQYAHGHTRPPVHSTL